MLSDSSVSLSDMSSDSECSEDSPSEMALPAAMVLSGIPKDQFTGNLQTVFTQGSVLLRSPRSASVLQTQASSRPSTFSSSAGFSSMVHCSSTVVTSTLASSTAGASTAAPSISAPSMSAQSMSAPYTSAPSTSGPSPVSALSTDSSLSESGIASLSSSSTEKSLDYYLNVINKIEQKFQSDKEPENDNDEDESPPNKKMCSQRKSNTPSWSYKFESSWLTMPIFKGWLEQADDGDQPHSSKTEIHKKSSYCKICKIRILSRESVLRNHAEKDEHKQNAAMVAENVKKTVPLSNSTKNTAKVAENVKNTSPLLPSNSAKIAVKVAENVKNTSLLPLSILTKNVRRAELKLCGFIIAHNLPLSLIDSLTPFLQDILSDSEIAKHMTLNMTKCTALITEILGKYYLEKLYRKLREPGCFFSLIANKVTEDGLKTQYAFAVRYYDIVKCNIVTNFFDIVETEEGNANDLVNALRKRLIDENIPLSNFVAFSSLCTAIAIADNSSVSTLLKKEVPNILCFKCSCHMTHSVISQACLKLPKSVGYLIRDIGVQLSRSPPRTDQLRKFQLFFKSDFYKRTNLNVCWLSLQNFVDKFIECIQPLKAYVTELASEEASPTIVEMLSTLKDPFTQVYLEFMSYVHGLMNNLNTQFKSNTPLLHKTKLEISMLLKTICFNFMNIELIRKTDIFKLNHKDPDNHVKLENMYIGIAAYESFQSLTSNPELEQASNEFLSNILEFYIDLVTNIKNSFEFDDPVFDLLLLFEPNIAQSFQEKSLKGIIGRFPILNKFIKLQKLDNEWRQHALLDFKELNLESTTDIEYYWKKIFQMKNVIGEELFPNLKKVVCFLLTLTYSNVCKTSIFEDISNIKSNKENAFDISTLKAVLASKQGIEEGGGCVQYEPESDMINCNIWQKYE